jgi:hypothetical protein
MKHQNFSLVNKKVEIFLNEQQQQQLTNANAQTKLEKIYKTARPVLVFLSTAFFVPKNWRIVVSALVNSVDEILKK